MIECVDEILHFFLIRSVQLTYDGYSETERSLVYETLLELYDNLCESFSDFIEIGRDSRMVKKHR